MTEEDARLALLQTELGSIQSAIRSLDVIVFQIKGWCVTVALAAAGFAAAYSKTGLLFVGAGAIVGFYLECYSKVLDKEAIAVGVSP
jgi:hypothetical protein